MAQFKGLLLRLWFVALAGYPFCTYPSSLAFLAGFMLTTVAETSGYEKQPRQYYKKELNLPNENVKLFIRLTGN
jgi:hypothetical protein